MVSVESIKDLLNNVAIKFIVKKIRSFPKLKHRDTVVPSKSEFDAVFTNRAKIILHKTFLEIACK